MARTTLPPQPGRRRRIRSSLSFVRIALVLVPLLAHAAALDGVDVPNTVQMNGKTLLLNGYGLRTYSFLSIHIYVAALYLEHLSSDPEAILRSPETKLLSVTFKHDVSVDAARNAWRTGLANNCEPPCHLDPDEVEKFLAVVPGMQSGDSFSLVFTPQGATVTVNGQLVGTVSHPQLAEAMLATFLGPKPASPELKQELLAGQPGGTKP